MAKKKKRRKYNKNLRKAHGYISDLEFRFHKFLDKLGIDAAYEKYLIVYEIPAIKKTYRPDFIYSRKKGVKIHEVTKDDYDDLIFIETKGRFTKRDQNKMLWVKEHNPTLDIRMVFMDDRVIDGRKKGRRDGEQGLRRKGQRHSDWCIDNGFPHHIGETPPKKWFK